MGRGRSWLLLFRFWRSCPEDGFGCIIISPTRELAGQLFEVLNNVGKYHNISAGLLIGGRKDVDSEKEHVSSLNILVCTPGRLLQHMDETTNFECPDFQVLVLVLADHILDVGFKKELNALISRLPKCRQTFLFSATQTKSVEDLARLSLKDPEYLSVHEESATATPDHLQQTIMDVHLEQINGCAMDLYKGLFQFKDTGVYQAASRSSSFLKLQKAPSWNSLEVPSWKDEAGKENVNILPIL